MQISSKGPSIARSEPFEKFFSELYSNYRQPLYKYLVGIVGRKDVAEDICQDVFAKLWSSRDKYAGVVDDYSAFLFRMAHNEAISYLRKESQKQYVFKSANSSNENALNLTEQVVQQRELEALLQMAIGKLSPNCRRVYQLGKIEGVPLDKLAVMLNLSYQTVKNQMQTANQQIRNYINK